MLFWKFFYPLKSFWNKTYSVALSGEEGLGGISPQYGKLAWPPMSPHYFDPNCWLCNFHAVFGILHIVSPTSRPHLGNPVKMKRCFAFKSINSTNDFQLGAGHLSTTNYKFWNQFCLFLYKVNTQISEHLSSSSSEK